MRRLGVTIVEKLQDQDLTGFQNPLGLIIYKREILIFMVLNVVHIIYHEH